jgi:hypothetical protein
VENSGAQKQASLASVPEDVVKVHTDTSTGQQIMVYEFVDPRSGAAIFQIPSKQMLSLVQGIRERLQQMAANQPGVGEVKPAEK